MKSSLRKMVGLLLLTGTLLGIGVPIATAQDWRRERREERRAERIERRVLNGFFRSIRGMDRDRVVRYQFRGGRRYVGYYDRFGDFHAVGYYDQFGNFWRYR